MDDAALRQFVLDELEWEPGLDASNIGVTADDGVVTLTGHVPNYAQKIAAERVAKAVKGVRALAQELEVRLIADVCADDDIAKRAVNALDWNVLVPEDRIQVRVENGFVSLNGEVDWQYQRRAAEEAVRNLSGVCGLTDLITIKPSPSAQTSDIKRRIEDALERQAELEAGKIKVTVDEGRVRLEGKVKAWYERDIVERAAWAAPGVKSVEDHVVVGL